MILVDFNQTMISNLFVQLGNHINTELDPGILRHMILNSLRSYNMKFKNEYGDMIICVDSKYSWRRGVFPYYKANRREDRKKSDLDWNALFSFFDDIVEEIKEYLPYKLIQIRNAEADDVIGTIVHELGPSGMEILILSGDKDFIQLHTYPNVRQYDPVRKKRVSNEDPIKYKKMHIYKGDRGDGVPNVYSPDDIFVKEGSPRQKNLTEKRIAEIDAGNAPSNIYRNITRNEMLIDLKNTPKSLRDSILEEYNSINTKDRSKLFEYFMNNDLNQLIDKMSEF